MQILLKKNCYEDSAPKNLLKDYQPIYYLGTQRLAALLKSTQ
jgi:hypothetical protein